MSDSPLDPVPYVLGLDPGSHRVGYATIARVDRKLVATCGTFEAKKNDPPMVRLLHLCSQLQTWAVVMPPPVALVTEHAWFRKNIQTAIGLGESRGALLGTLWAIGWGSLGSPEFSLRVPAPQCRKTLGLSNRAGKADVAYVLEKYYGDVVTKAKTSDAVDALGLAHWAAVHHLGWVS